jgi:Ca2+-binding RTX toxin-like protein
METLIGGNGNDFLTGTEVADVIIGNERNKSSILYNNGRSIVNH